MAEGHLGAHSDYAAPRTAADLVAIPRAASRPPRLQSQLHHASMDLWRAHEFAWRTAAAPRTAILHLQIPAHSPATVESKSLKLFLGDHHRRTFASDGQLLHSLQGDLGALCGAPVQAQLCPIAPAIPAMRLPPAALLDGIPVQVPSGGPHPDILQPAAHRGPWMQYSHLFRSLCPVTGQPDHATIILRGHGTRPHPASALAYLLSFGGHGAYHESCVEQIFAHLMQRLAPRRLAVQGCFLRRGGIDINPYRTSHSTLHFMRGRAPRQ